MVPFEIEFYKRESKFSSPLEDGLVLFDLQNIKITEGFRPRLGMGWFMIDCSKTENYFIFSSPSGDGLVHNYCPNCGAKMEFSSPLGDGLVLFCGVLFFSFFRRFSSPSGDGLVHPMPVQNYIFEKIFVPAWGWVGS